MPQGPSSPRSYYDILGVNPTATADEIKSAYRKLARTLHPDVNPNDPQASQKFAEVTTAYKALSDTLARSTYDAEQSLKARREETARARAGGATSHASYATQTPRPGATRSTPNPQQPTANTGDEAVRLVNDARAAVSRMRFMEARDLAQRSLRIKRTAEGYEVLGDVYRLQGRTEDAINMYTMSLQLNPRNSLMMDRLQRLARGSGGNQRRYDVRSDSPSPSAGNGPSPRPSSGYAPDAPYTPRPGAVGANILPEKRPLLKMFAVFFGFGVTFLLLASLLMFPATSPLRNGPVPIPAISKWSGGLIAVLIGCGIATGWTMSVTDMIRRLDDELVFSRAQSGFVPPMGPVLMVLSAISFWAAAILHLLLSALQEARVTGILRVFGAVTGIVLLAGLFYPDDGRTQVFLWGGNLVFLSYIFGWFVGDMFRTD